jgi:hypothetical protein
LNLDDLVLERVACPEAASLWYKIIDFEAWADYLGDAPLAMAMFDAWWMGR